MGHSLFRQLNSLKDQYLLRHHAGVALYAGLISLAVCPRMADLVHAAAEIHDTGKALVPDEILFKPGCLTDREWVIMQAHPVSGAQLFMKNGARYGLEEKRVCIWASCIITKGGTARAIQKDSAEKKYRSQPA